MTISPHKISGGACVRCGERADFIERIGIPCRDHDDEMQDWWDNVVMSGVKPIAKIRQSNTREPAAEPSLFDFMGEVQV